MNTKDRNYDIEACKDLIVNELQSRYFDIIFQAVSDEMNKQFIFNQSNYLTEAGEDLFLDQWFEFYHEHHGDILHRILKKLEP
tara:strand:+ start:324 stop:572 length:249 start_codon:yes stop_codon:yes gene_type:complete